jgi:uncharacterized protein (TIGR03437 family)
VTSIIRISLAFALTLFFEGRSVAQAISFARSGNIPIALGSASVTSGDFNGDGKLDLVVSSASNAVLLLGNGDGSFKSVDLGFVANITLVADVNRDKKADLIVLIGNLAYVLLGNGDGTFQPPKLIPAFPLIVADFNGDSNPDLLAQCQNGAISVYPGNGDGTFRSSLPCAAETRDGDWSSDMIVVGDLNGDGKLDVVWGNVRSSNYIWIWLGNGDGTFQNPYPVDAGTDPGGKPIALGDLNHDGKPDIVVGTTFGVAVLFGNGDGTFQNHHPPTPTTPGGPAFLLFFDGLNRLGYREWRFSNDIFIRDFDGDGNPDIVLDGILFRGKGDGTFYSAQFLGIDSAGAISVICEDLNGDGKPDLVYLDLQPGTNPGSARMLSILLNNSPNGLPNNVLGYSAATGGSLLAPSSFASIYGKNLAKVTASAAGAIFPTTLGGISLRVRDDTNTLRLAPLILVSPTQINFVVPAQTSIGPVTLNVDDGSPPLFEGANATIVNNLAAGFFTVSQNGEGIPAATAVRIWADGTQESVPVFTCSGTGQCNAAPIDLTSGLPVYLSLYGTGFGLQAGKFPPLGAGQCQVGGKDATVQFAGPHAVYAGLDQVNLLIPQPLPSGQASVQCRFYFSLQGNQSNVVSIAIK